MFYLIFTLSLYLFYPRPLQAKQQVFSVRKKKSSNPVAHKQERLGLVLEPLDFLWKIWLFWALWKTHSHTHIHTHAHMHTCMHAHMHTEKCMHRNTCTTIGMLKHHMSEHTTHTQSVSTKHSCLTQLNNVLHLMTNTPIKRPEWNHVLIYWGYILVLFLLLMQISPFKVLMDLDDWECFSLAPS